MKVTPQNIGAVVDRHLGDGRSAADVQAWLVRQGVPEARAVTAVEKGQARAHVGRLSRRARRNTTLRILLGAVFLAVGLSVTVYTYTAADAGDTFVVMWGAIAVGVLTLGQGLWARAKARRAVSRLMADLA